MPQLHPELEKNFNPDTGLLHHPLLIVSIGESLFEQTNKQYTLLRQLAVTSWLDRNWKKYVFLHARPYRLQALKRCVKAGLEGANFWALLGAVWCDSENIFQSRRYWRKLWNSKEPNRTATMNYDEQRYFRTIGKTVTVWRGSSQRHNSRALSWTTSLEVALRFGERFASAERGSFLATGIVAKKDVLAAFLRRDEHELVCNLVKISKIEELTR